MRTILFLSLAVLTLCLTAIAQDNGVQKLSGPGILPTVATPNLQPMVFSNQYAPPKETPFGYEISEEHLENLKQQENEVSGTLGGHEIDQDKNIGNITLAPVTGASFNGLGQLGWIPYDAAIAVGPNHVLEMTNAQWGIYSRTGTNLAVTQFSSWWGTAAGTPFDPKCYYDNSGHFVMIATSVGNGMANMYVSISQTSDPTGAWWNYTFDWRLDGSTMSGNWGDYPGLGFNDNAIFINANQYTISSNSFRYSKVRVLSKTQLFSGSAAGYTDFINLSNANGTSAFTVKPARCISSSSSEYLLNTLPGGGNFVTLWRIDNAPSSPSLTRVGAVLIGSYSVPPDAKQKGIGILISTGDCRTQDVVWQNGYILTGFSERIGSNRNAISAVRYLKINTANANADKDITYTASGVYMYYPAISADASGNMFMTFSRSGKSEYASMYQTGMLITDGSIQPSALVKAGVSKNSSGRWGDYSGIANDPNDGGTLWLYCGWANTSNRWATWNASATFGSPGSPLAFSQPTTNSAFALKGNYPNPFNPTTVIYFAIPQASNVKLTIYNALGQVVGTLVNDYLDAGEHYAQVDGSQMSSGAYFYRLAAGGNTAVGKMLLIK
jgi:Secretion system C-terminal sorting domain